VALLVALIALIVAGDSVVLQAAAGICVALLPLATGAAILRIISRTVAYGLLTLLLGLGYAEVDLDTLTAELLAVVNQTMQPTRASLWLRPHRAAGNAMVHQRT
jgi:hypothetical protein